MGFLSRMRESAAIRCIQASLSEKKSSGDGVAAARRLSELGSERCIPILKDALFREHLPLKVQSARALAAIYQREPSNRILEILHSAALNERQPAQARQAAVESLAEIIDVRHPGSLIEILKSARSPVAVRATALRCLKRLGYPQVLERLVECAIFGKTLDPRGEIRTWATRELTALEDRDKLSKLFEIIHGRRRLKYRAINPKSGGPGALVSLMPRIDARGCRRYLEDMVADENPAIHEAAEIALAALKAPQG